MNAINLGSTTAEGLLGQYYLTQNPDSNSQADRYLGRVASAYFQNAGAFDGTFLVAYHTKQSGMWDEGRLALYQDAEN